MDTATYTTQPDERAPTSGPEGWTGPDILSVIMAALALVVSIGFGIKQTRTAGKSATASEKSATASEQSAAEARRAADAAERSATAGETTAQIDVERRLEESRPDVRILMGRPPGLSDEELSRRGFATIRLDNRSGVRLAWVTLKAVGPGQGFGEFKFVPDKEGHPVRRWGWLPGAETSYSFEDVEPGNYPRENPRRTRPEHLLFAYDLPTQSPITFLVSFIAEDGRQWPPVQVEPEQLF